MGCCNSFFSLQAGKDKIIDINASFSPRSWPIRIFKFLCLAATIAASVLFLQLFFQDEDKLQYIFYFAYFTVWGLLCSALYFITSWLNTVVPLRQCNNAIERPSFRTKWTWVVFEVAAHTEMTVTVLYWTLIYDKDGDDDDTWEIGNIMAHGGVMVLVLITGLVVNRVPVRLSHFIFPFVVDACYLMWTYLHDRLALGNENGPDGNEEGDDDGAIYDVIDWTDNFKSTAILAVIVLFVVGPGLWVLLWILSLCGRRTMDAGYTCNNDTPYGSVAYANEQVGRNKRRRGGLF